MEEVEEVFSEPENSSMELPPLNSTRETQSEEEEEREEEEEDNDAEIFSAWMCQYRAGEAEKLQKEEEAGGEAKSQKLPVTLHAPTRRRSSLPCPVTLSAMQFHRLHSATQPPVTAKVLLHRTSSRGLLLSAATSSPPTSSPPNAERRSSIISIIPEVAQSKKTHFRRRNIMSMSDADSVCLICHNDFSKRDSGIQELQCSHTFHKQCIDEWLWSKQSCPTCQIHVSLPQPTADAIDSALRADAVDSARLLPPRTAMMLEEV
ncbi:RING-H2 finger protein ATL72 [Merluccius polli]|uniref:RING-H2 finger protein ATL72 n=1 Tax=Merluccius polli TaxID=89951 RepID=A0AA47NXB9_MERPO|nr:RING-H2 finger protein ATL72 [Merluccius polli]